MAGTIALIIVLHLSWVTSFYKTVETYVINLYKKFYSPTKDIVLYVLFQGFDHLTAQALI